MIIDDIGYYFYILHFVLGIYGSSANKQNSLKIQSINHLRHFIFEIFHKLYCYQLNLFTIFSIKAKNGKKQQYHMSFPIPISMTHFLFTVYFLSWITSSIYLYKNKPSIAINMGHIDRGDSTNFKNKYHIKTMNEPYWSTFVSYRRINRCYLHNVLIHLPLLYLHWVLICSYWDSFHPTSVFCVNWNKISIHAV